MKIKKNITIAIIATALLVTLCGCKEASGNITNPSQSNEDGVDSNEENSCCVAPTEIIIGDTNFKDGLIKRIKDSKKMVEEHKREHGYNLIDEILDVKEFLVPAVKIDGYEPYIIQISQYEIGYFYRQIEMQKNDELISINFDTDIGIMITQPGWVRNESLNQFEFLVEQIKEQGRDVIIQDNTLYGKNEYVSYIYAPIGENSCIRVEISVKFDDYKYLRDLVFEVIETAELVVVEDYL